MRKQELHPRTAVINKSQKNKSKQIRMDALKWLASTFPEAFDNSLRIRPLKNGIMDDILLHADAAAQAGISKSKLREAVVLFTRRIDYLTCLKAREMRIDLDGQSVGEVSEDDAERASLKIKKRVEKSARNARKNLNLRPSATSGSTTYPSANHSNAYHSTNASGSDYPKKSAYHAEDNFPVYPTRSPAYPSDSKPIKAPTKSTSVIVKQKPSRSFDPDAVARLKAKLGISRKEEANKETSD